jgi:hypothetical protein
MFDTWICHVCKRERPDAAISVLTTTVTLGDSRFTAQQNIRFCNDNPTCVAGAHDVRFIKEDS